jgi:hypothetical protein
VGKIRFGAVDGRHGLLQHGHPGRAGGVVGLARHVGGDQALLHEQVVGRQSAVVQAHDGVRVRPLGVVQAHLAVAVDGGGAHHEPDGPARPHPDDGGEGGQEPAVPQVVLVDVRYHGEGREQRPADRLVPRTDLRVGDVLSEWSLRVHVPTRDRVD